jgi:hypothetical protein
VPIRAIACATALGLATVTTAVATSTEKSLFGIALGQPLTLPECPRHPNIRGYDHVLTDWSGLCADLQERVKHPWGTEELHVWFPFKATPAYVRREAFWVQLMGGKVASIRFATCGERCQQAALSALEAKFGPPQSTKRRRLANRMGATFTSQDAAWNLGGTTVVFTGIADDVDWGEVEASTPEYLAADRAWRDKKNREIPKL